MSKEPVFVSIVSEAAVYNDISGKFIFHSMKNKTGAYVRDGDKDFMVSKFKTIPVLRYQKPFFKAFDVHLKYLALKPKFVPRKRDRRKETLVQAVLSLLCLPRHHTRWPLPTRVPRSSRRSTVLPSAVPS